MIERLLRGVWQGLGLAIGLGIGVAVAANFTSFQGGAPLSADQMNANFQALDERIDSTEEKLGNLRVQGGFAQAGDIFFQECQDNPSNAAYCAVMASSACTRLGFKNGWYRPNVDGSLLYANAVVCLMIP